MSFAPLVLTRARVPSRRSSASDLGFERFLTDAFFGGDKPGFEALQDDKGWNLSIDMPGVAREDLAISTEGPIVRIETRAESKRRYKAAYELADEIDAEGTTAKL